MDLLTQMETFVRVVEAGSFSVAAKQLRVSVAAVSRHVAALEDEIATSLIARTTRKLTITPAGRTYYESCVRVLREVEQAQAIGRLGIAGPLRLSVPVSVGALAGDMLVDSLLARHPDLRIDLRVEDQLIDLALDNVDIAIRVGAAPPVSSDVVAVPLANWTRVVVASPAYLARHAAPKVPADLARHDGLSTTRGAKTDVWTLIDGSNVARVRVRTRFSTNAGHLLRHAALEGRGVALLPDWYVADDIAGGVLTRLLSAWKTDATPVNALYRASLRTEQRARTVIDHLRQAFSDGTWRAAALPKRRGEDSKRR